MDECAVRLDHVVFKRGHRAICNDMQLEIPRGKVTAIMGPSGTGKTTLLHIIGGLLSVESGEVQVLGHPMARASRAKWFELRKSMGMLFQSGALFTDMTAFDNVAFPLRENTNLPEDIIRNIVLMKLEAVGLRGAKGLMPSELSGGMSRRVALARAIALDPELMLYDEPFTGQDPISMGVLLRLIKTLNKSLGLTSIVVSHDINEVMSVADYVCIISGGKVVGQGSPEALRASDAAFVQQFIGGLDEGPVPFHFEAPSFESELKKVIV